MFGQPLVPHPQPWDGEEQNRMQIQCNHFCSFIHSSFQMFAFVSLGLTWRVCYNTIVPSCCQKAKFIFSISGQIEKTKENNVWGQMLKTWVLCSLSWKSKELKWKTSHAGYVSLDENFYLQEWIAEGFQLPKSFEFKLRLDQLLPHWVPLDELTSIFNWMTPMCQVLYPHRT